MERNEGSRHDHHFQLALEGCHVDMLQASAESKSPQRPDQLWEGQTPSHLEDEGGLFGYDKVLLCEVGHVVGDTSKVAMRWKVGV